MSDAFLATLVSKELLTEEVKEEKEKQKLSNEIDALTDIFNRGPQYWNKVLAWGTSRKMLTEKDASILKMTANMFVTGRIISDKQAQIVMAVRKRLIDYGMPMQF